MKTYDRICPVCGCLNRKLYLEETGGMMECERCGTISQGTFGGEITKAGTGEQPGEGNAPEWEWPGVMTVLPAARQLCRPTVQMT